jgi:hypothetical protein
MIDLINRIYVYKGLALLIFTAILTNMFFSRGPGIIRTQPVRGYNLTTNNTSRIYLPIIRAAGGPGVSPTPKPTLKPTLKPTPTSTPPTPPSNYTEALFLNTSNKTNHARTTVAIPERSPYLTAARRLIPASTATARRPTGAMAPARSTATGMERQPVTLAPMSTTGSRLRSIFL